MTRIRILNFHGIGSPERALDPGEAPFWLSGDQFERVLDRIVAHPERPSLRLTFDDGNRSDLTIAAPALASRELKACFFLLTGRLGRAGSVSGGDVRELVELGMTIGSHGIDHADLPQLAAVDLKRELAHSRQVLQELSGQPVDGLAVPFGHYSAAVLAAAREAGYRTVFTSDGGDASPAAAIQPRRSLRGDMTAQDIDNVLSGRMPVLRRLRRTVAMAVKRFA